MTVKSNMTKPDRKKRVKINRDAVVVEYVVPELVVPDVAPDVVVPQPLELSIDISEQLDKLMDESSCVGDCEDPTSPVNSPKRKLRKPSEPKPLVNERGEYLNPRTNRYVKSGTSAYKQLVKDGVIVVLEN
jgi:hypothetical protein